MNRIWICLNSFERVKKFIDITDQIECELELISEGVTINGKCLLEIFTLDLTKPIEIIFHEDIGEEKKKFEQFAIGALL